MQARGVDAENQAANLVLAQANGRHRRIIGMQRQPHARAFCDRQHLVEETLQPRPELLVRGRRNSSGVTRRRRGIGLQVEQLRLVIQDFDQVRNAFAEGKENHGCEVHVPETIDVKAIREKISRACARAGRSSSAITR